MEQSRARRLMFVILGHVALVIGITGFFNPLVPAVPFILLAGTCYAKGSDRCHRWLLNNRFFGKTVRDWHEKRKISAAAWFAVIVSAAMTIGFIVWCLL